MPYFWGSLHNHKARQQIIGKAKLFYSSVNPIPLPLNKFNSLNKTFITELLVVCFYLLNRKDFEQTLVFIKPKCVNKQFCSLCELVK